MEIGGILSLDVGGAQARLCSGKSQCRRAIYCNLLGSSKYKEYRLTSLAYYYMYVVYFFIKLLSKNRIPQKVQGYSK